MNYREAALRNELDHEELYTVTDLYVDRKRGIIQEALTSKKFPNKRAAHVHRKKFLTRRPGRLLAAYP